MDVMPIDDNILTAIFQESVLIFLIIGSFFALLLGVLFLLSPEHARALSLRYSHWSSLRQPSRPLELPHSIDSYFYRQHRVIGLILLLSASYILYRFAFDYDHIVVVHLLTRIFGNSILVEWLLEASLWFILPISALIAIFGAIMAIKPSALKGLETLLNRWISSRKLLQPIEKQHKSVDRWMLNRPRGLGLALTLAAGYNLAILITFFISHIR
jgi:hypothetical protein